MKVLSKISLLVLLIVSFVSCGKRMQTSSNPANAYILADSIRQASTGNCAISINLESLYHGNIVKTAITDTKLFNYSNYNAATGETLANNTELLNLSYNRKFDAFWSNGGAWNEDTRKEALKKAASVVNAASVLGAAYVIAQGIPGGPSVACSVANTQYVAAVEAYYNTFTEAEKTVMNTIGFSAATSPSSNYSSISIPNFTALQGALTTSCSTIASPSSPVDVTKLASAYLAGLSRKKGAALLACTRIPRSGCNFGSLTTASLEDAKKFQAAVYEALQNNGDCRKPTDSFMINNADKFFKGLSAKDELKAAGITFKGGMQIKDDGTKLSEGSKDSFSDTSGNNILYAKKAYPLSSALASVSSSFLDAFPLKEGNTPYNDETFSGGSNVNAKPVESCDTLGLAMNPSPGAGDNLRKKLTPPAEIVYSLSVNGAAAASYASIVSPFSPNAIACNKSFRKKFQVPPSLNEKLPDLDVPFGDGGATGLTSLCVYGRDATTVSTIKGILGTSTSSTNPAIIPGIDACPASAREGASTFANEGLNSITNSFPFKE